MQTFSPNHEKKDLTEMMHHFMVENDLKPVTNEGNKRLPPQQVQVRNVRSPGGGAEHARSTVQQAPRSPKSKSQLPPPLNVMKRSSSKPNTALPHTSQPPTKTVKAKANQILYSGPFSSRGRNSHNQMESLDKIQPARVSSATQKKLNQRL